MLKEAYKAQTELQTELTLAKSNLQLALANNEMLEDALKRDGPGTQKMLAGEDGVLKNRGSASLQIPDGRAWRATSRSTLPPLL